MSLQTLRITLLATLVLPTFTRSILTPSKVFYYDQLPSDAYSGDPDVAANKERIYVRKDINLLDPQNGPSITCLPNGQVRFGFSEESGLKLDELAAEKFLDHPIVIPHGYDSSCCPELGNHTIYGPRSDVPAEALDDLEEQDDFAVLIATSEDDVQDNELTVSVDWVTYHELIGITGDAPEELFWLAKGVYPFSETNPSASSRMKKRQRFRVRGRISGGLLGYIGCALVGGAPNWCLDQIAGAITGRWGN